MKSIQNDIEGKVFSILIVLGIMVSGFIVLANGEELNLANQYNLIYFNNNDIKIQNNINENNIIEKFNSYFNKNKNFSKLNNYSINFELEFNKIEENTKRENEFYIGFSEYSQVVYDKNYFEIKTKNNTISIIHKGKELSYGEEFECKKNCNLQIQYNISNLENNVNLRIYFEGKKIYDENAKLDEEFDKGFLPNNFWYTIPKNLNNEFVIKKFYLKY